MTFDRCWKNAIGICLDFIRAIAALAVLVEHAAERISPHVRDISHSSFSFGKFGVTAFFLTSGFVIPFTLERGHSHKRFWISRFFRLYPLYWLSLFLVLGSYLVGITNAVTPAFPTHFLRNSLINITMVQQFLGVPNAEGLYYTLGMEMAFYFVLFLYNFHHRSLQIAWLAAASLAFSGTLVPLLLHRRLPMAGLFYFLCLLVGTTIYRNLTNEVTNQNLAFFLTFVWLTTVAEIVCNYVFIKKADLNEQFTLGAVHFPWLTAYVVFLLADWFRIKTFPQIFVWLGTISYSVYLLHPNVARIIPGSTHGTLSFLFVLAVTLLLSTSPTATSNNPSSPSAALSNTAHKHQPHVHTSPTCGPTHPPIDRSWLDLFSRKSMRPAPHSSSSFLFSPLLI
jgi:peptidoglycan/LPS O-acetylase OafA/YrhL